MALENEGARAGPASRTGTEPAVAQPAAPEPEFPPSIGKVAHRALAHHGLTRWDQLTTVTRAELLRIHGVGPKSVTILGEELASRRLSFKSP